MSVYSLDIPRQGSRILALDSTYTLTQQHQQPSYYQRGNSACQAKQPHLLRRHLLGIDVNLYAHKHKVHTLEYPKICRHKCMSTLMNNKINYYA